jgi:hypothetical protein
MGNALQRGKKRLSFGRKKERKKGSRETIKKRVDEGQQFVLTLTRLKVNEPTLSCCLTTHTSYNLLWGFGWWPSGKKSIRRLPKKGAQKYKNKKRIFFFL